jgi:hypothetical protein
MGREEWNIGGGFGMGWEEQDLREGNKLFEGLELQIS